MKLEREHPDRQRGAEDVVNERQRHGKRRARLDLTNGMRITALTNVTDESRTMTMSGLAEARTNTVSVISALPFTL